MKAYTYDIQFTKHNNHEELHLIFHLGLSCIYHHYHHPHQHTLQSTVLPLALAATLILSRYKTWRSQLVKSFIVVYEIFSQMGYNGAFGLLRVTCLVHLLSIYAVNNSPTDLDHAFIETRTLEAGCI